MRLEAAWFQGVLFSLLYRQCADTIKDKAIIAIKRRNSKNQIKQKTSHSHGSLDIRTLQTGNELPYYKQIDLLVETRQAVAW